MSAPLIPSPLDYIGHRRFALYPPIRSAEPNEWLLGSGSWFEVRVVNAATGREMWIPRQYVAGVSDRNGILVVELTEEIEFRAGALEPKAKRVIEMPVAPPQPQLQREHRNSGPACVVGIRLDDQAQSSMSKAMVTLGIGALVISLLAVLISVLAR